jgi:hypothetical protein
MFYTSKDKGFGREETNKIFERRLFPEGRTGGVAMASQTWRQVSIGYVNATVLGRT